MLAKRLREFACLLSGHDFIRIKNYSFMTDWELIECDRCKNKYIMSLKNETLVPFSIELDLAGEGIVYDDRLSKK